MALPDIRIVCATRVPAAAFRTETALGRSLAASYDELSYLDLALHADNAEGLSAVYNREIERAAREPAVLLFCHDDIQLPDFYWPDRLYAGLEQYELIGIVGSRMRRPRQPAWSFKDEWFSPDGAENLSGFIAHGTSMPARVTRYGLLGPCRLLDGLFLAVRSETLIRVGLRFDERFLFHFYDLDLCREAEARGLRMGTVPIAVMHESIGKLRTQDWRTAFQTYLDKWGE